MKSNLLARRIGVTVQTIARLRGMNAKGLGTRAGYTEPQMSRLLNGGQHWREFDLTAIAAALDVEPGLLFKTPQMALRALRAHSAA